ncbi:MAG: hypothetical protein V1904_04845 [Bacteroidota bacterium]
MDIINTIVQGMNKEDIRFFKLYLSRTNADKDRMDIRLFDYIKKSGEKYDEKKIFPSLYKTKEKNSFYRLKHRLAQDLNTSIFLQHFEKDDTIYIFFLLSLAKYYMNKNKYDVANYFLQKAEKKAVKIENFELLDLIYIDFLKLSGEVVSINPEQYLNKRKLNSEKISKIRQIDDILTVVTYKLKITQNFSPSENPIFKVLEKTVNEVSNDEELKNSSLLQFRIYEAVSRILLQRHDFATLEVYLLKTYKQFNQSCLFTKTNHHIKLQILTYLVNTLFKNKKQKESLEYADKLKSAMEEYNALLYDKYMFFYYHSLVINYSGINTDKAIEVLEELKHNEKIKNTPYYEVFVYLNLGIQWFDKKDYRKAISNLNKLYMHDGYKNTDDAFKFKVSVTELIIRFELNDFDFLEHRIEQLKKDYADIFSKEENAREKEFIEIILSMMVTQEIEKNKTLSARIKNFMKQSDDKGIDDTEMINYNSWLKGKLK